MKTEYRIKGSGDFTELTIIHNGREYIYTGKTAQAIIAAMQAYDKQENAA